MSHLATLILTVDSLPGLLHCVLFSRLEFPLIIYLFIFVVLGLKHRALCVSGKGYTTELHPKPLGLFPSPSRVRDRPSQGDSQA